MYKRKSLYYDDMELIIPNVQDYARGRSIENQKRKEKRKRKPLCK
jgi:hypothetical protein